MTAYRKLKQAEATFHRAIEDHLRRRASLADVACARDAVDRARKAHQNSIFRVIYFRS